MAITRFKNSSIANKGPKYDNALAGLPYIPIIGTATDGGNGTSVSVAFTGNNVAGAGVTYTALSTPGSITATGAASPITVTGLTSGTEYTFQVKAGNSLGDSAYSAASNSVTPVQPTAFESIATATGTGSSGTITFSNIPSGYQHLQIRYIAKVTTTTQSNYDLTIRFNGDTAANYASHALKGSGAAVSTATSSSATSMLKIIEFPIPSSATIFNSMFGVGIIDIHDYLSTSKNKTVRAFSGLEANRSTTPTGFVSLGSGLWFKTPEAITSISLIASGSTLWTTTSQFALFGIKGA